MQQDSLVIDDIGWQMEDVGNKTVIELTMFSIVYCIRIIRIAAYQT